MKKRLITLTMAVVMMVSATGCGMNEIISEVQKEAYRTSQSVTMTPVTTGTYGSGENSGTNQNASAAQLPEVPGVDFESEIEYFAESFDNVVTFSVGNNYRHGAAIWVQNGGTIYTSDSSVISVAGNGNVRAEGSGVAYVIYMGRTGMYVTVKFVVN